MNSGEALSSILKVSSPFTCLQFQEATHGIDFPIYLKTDNFLHQNLIPTNLTLESTLPSLPPSEKAPFLDFVRKLLQWSPEKRKTAKELLEDPWFAGLKLPK